MLSLAAAGPGLLPGDLSVALVIQRAPVPGGDHVARVLTELGRTVPAVVASLPLGAALLLTGHRGEATLLALAAAARMATIPLKEMVGSPRPTADLVTITEQAAGLGFPSGHALGAILFYGSLWLIVPSVLPPGWPARLARIVAVSLILLTALARVRVGAHWPSDVLGGLLWGTILLTAAALATSTLLPRQRNPAPEFAARFPLSPRN